VIELPAAADPAVSVIVLLDGAVEMAERCLGALAAHGEEVATETVVVLNDPDPELERFARRSTRGARLVLCRANAGPGVGWNLGAAAARAPRLATLHEDSEPEPGWLPPLLEAMEGHRAGAVGSRLLNGDGSVQNCGWVLFADAAVQPLCDANAAATVAATEPTPADMLSGAAMLVDREAVRAAGGWDERFHPAVFVDIDVSTALWNLGRPVLSVPASRVRHQSFAFDRRRGSALTGPRLREMLLERNRDPFLAKWGPFVTGRAAAPDAADPDAVTAATAAALELTAERAARARAGGWRPPLPGARAERRFTGLAEPPLVPTAGGMRVAPAVEAALGEAEAELVAEYCLWLVRREAEDRERLRAVQEALEEWRDHYGELQGAHDELARRLNQILGGRTWRLRSAIMRALRRSS
jgi:GT2 family glycosyltransferase